MSTSSESSSDDVEEVDEEQVEVRFTTRIQDPACKIASTPFYLPTRLGRKGLSQAVNHLLALDKPRPFDFVINDTLVRSTLAKYISTHQLSAEETLEIEYTEIMKPPTEESQLLHDDWVSSVCEASSGQVITGSYDNVVRVWNTEDGTCVAAGEGHRRPIKAVACLSEGKDRVRFVSGSQDHTLRVWSVKGADTIGEGVCLEHKGEVMAISVSPARDMFCSGGCDKTIRLWLAEEESDLANGKRRKTNTADGLVVKKQQVEFTGCGGDVTSLDWGVPETICSGSWDRSIRLWDAESAVNTVTLHGEKAVNCISYSQSNGLVVSGHMDYVIRLWDPRTPDGKLVRAEFRSHNGLVSGVAFLPKDSYTFASASYDGSVKFWDIRGAVPLNTVEAHTDKALCLCWGTSGGKAGAGARLYSGGADNQLRIHSVFPRAMTRSDV